MATKFIAPRRKKFAAFLAETGDFRQISFDKIRALVAKIKAQATNTHEELLIVACTLANGVFAHIFELPAGIFIFFSDGSALVAHAPLR